jgi:hypothetical protein
MQGADARTNAGLHGQLDAPKCMHECRAAQSGQKVLFHKMIRRAAYRAAVSAALGDLLSQQDVDHLYPIAVTHGEAAFSPVRL